MAYRTTLRDGREIGIAEAELQRFAGAIGLDQIAPGRYSKLFVFKLILYVHFEGVEGHFILDQLRALEGLPNNAPATKTATMFARDPLKGLWHQHFFSARFLAHNMLNQIGGDKLMPIVERIFDPEKSQTVTREMINELANVTTIDAIRQREAEGKLTGEWIVFAKHQGQNYYLTLAVHPEDKAGDMALYEELKAMPFKG